MHKQNNISKFRAEPYMNVSDAHISVDIPNFHIIIITIGVHYKQCFSILFFIFLVEIHRKFQLN